MSKQAENNPQGTANIADDRVLAPVVWKEKCFYCKKYDRIFRPDNRVNLRGTCLKNGNIVWKDFLCTDFDYNGC